MEAKAVVAMVKVEAMVEAAAVEVKHATDVKKRGILYEVALSCRL